MISALRRSVVALSILNNVVEVVIDNVVLFNIVKPCQPHCYSIVHPWWQQLLQYYSTRTAGFLHTALFSQQFATTCATKLVVVLAYSVARQPVAKGGLV